MSGAGFILSINMSVAGLLAAFFLVISLDAAYRSARWIALAYVFGMANAGAELLLSRLPGTFLPAALVYVTFLAALLAFNVGLARNYRVHPPWRLLVIVSGAGVALYLVTLGMERGSFLRMVLYQAPYAVMQAIGVVILLRVRKRAWIDNAFIALLSVSSLHYLAKPFIAVASDGVGQRPQDYLPSTYAMLSQSMAAVLSVAVALMLLAIYVRAMLSAATIRSETDTLSRLLNRRGFEDRVDTLMLAASRARSPLSVILCDLDRFKQANDTFGHLAGDRVIIVFADILARLGEHGHVAGRIGGEEFAIMLPGANLNAARLAAEGLRVAFAAAEIPGLGPEQRFTASFGVAQWHADESYPDLLRRADAALYDAKRDGRNCVRLAAAAQIVNRPPADRERRKFRGK